MSFGVRTPLPVGSILSNTFLVIIVSSSLIPFVTYRRGLSCMNIWNTYLSVKSRTP
jgi:hypothetical protein